MSSHRSLLTTAARRVLDTCEIIVATIAQAAVTDIAAKQFQTVVIEESGLIAEHEAMLALATEPHQLLLVGDEKQMKARMISNQAQKLKIDPLFHRAVKWFPSILLKQQRRMTSLCISISNALYYDNQLTTEPKIQAERDKDNLKAGVWKDHERTVTWLDIESKESKAKGSYSTQNDEEANHIVKVVKWLVDNSNGVYQLGDIACLTAYKAQVENIRKRLVQAGLGTTTAEEAAQKGEGPKDKCCIADTIDRFQGMQKKIILISMVRTKPTTSEHMRDPGRINVAVSRQTHGLIIVGSKANSVLMGDWEQACERIEKIDGELVMNEETPVNVLREAETAGYDSDFGRARATCYDSDEEINALQEESEAEKMQRLAFRLGQRKRLRAVIQEIKDVEEKRKVKLRQMALRRHECIMRMRWHRATTMAWCKCVATAMAAYEEVQDIIEDDVLLTIKMSKIRTSVDTGTVLR